MKRKLEAPDDGVANAKYMPVMPDRDNFNRNEYFSPTWEDCFHEVIPPKQSIDNTRTIEFELRPIFKNMFYDLSSIAFGSQLRLVDAEGNAVADNHIIAPINYFAQTMIESVVVYLNDEVAYNSGPYYAEKAFLLAQTNHTEGERLTTLYRQGYRDEAPTNINNPTFDDFGFADRAAFFGTYHPRVEPDPDVDPPVVGHDPYVDFNANPESFFTPILADVFTSENLLLPYVTCRIQITLHKDAYSLWCANNIANNDYRLELVRAELQVTRLRSHPTYFDQLREQMQKGPLKYRYKRLDMKAMTINAGEASFVARDFVQSSTNPTRGLVAMRLQSVSRPDKTVNPMQFNARFPGQNDAQGNATQAELTKFDFAIQGNKLEHSSLANNFNSFAQWHYYMFQQKMKPCGGEGLAFTPFSIQKYIIPFDLTTSGRANKSGNVRLPVKEGDFTIEVAFTNPLQHHVQMLILQEHHCSYTINANYVVSYKYLD